MRFRKGRIYKISATVYSKYRSYCLLFQKGNLRGRRIGNAPIITPEMIHGDDGNNINGPSVIRVPEWVSDRLGNYYMYFAHHNGKYIRLAYSNYINGPWTIHSPGTLRLSDCDIKILEGPYAKKIHVASPDVHIDELRKQIVMYYHAPFHLGGNPNRGSNYKQVTFRAISDNGLQFTSGHMPLAPHYLRVFQWNNQYYAFAREGKLFRSPDGLAPFEKCTDRFLRHGMKIPRHLAVMVHDSTLYVFYSRIGDAPESILYSRINLDNGWINWKVSRPKLLLRPTMLYEGRDLKIAISKEGMARSRVRQLRDPAILCEKDKVYLFYVVAGESGIAVAEINGW